MRSCLARVAPSVETDRGPRGPRSVRAFAPSARGPGRPPRAGLAALLLALTLLPAPARPERIKIEADRGGERLREALAAAQPGDSLLLAPGTYRGTFTLRSGVSIVGLAGPDSTILDAAGGRYVLYGRDLEPTTVVSGLTIQNGRRDHPNSGGGGIYLYSSSPTIVNNVFRHHLGYLGPGIYMYYKCRPIIAWNVFYDIEGYLGGAIAAYLDCHPVVYNNVIMGNRAVSGGAILCLNSAPVIIANTLVGNRASQNGGAIYCDSSPALIDANIVAEHMGSAAIFWLDDDRPASITGNQFWHNATGHTGGRCPPLIGQDGNREEDPQLGGPEPLALARAGVAAPKPGGAPPAGARPWDPRAAPAVPDSILVRWRRWVAGHEWP